MKEIDWKQKIYELARQQKIHLTEQEVGTFAPQLADIVDSFNELDKINTEDIKPSFHPFPVATIFRPDEQRKCTRPVENHARKEKGYLKAPRILKG